MEQEGRQSKNFKSECNSEKKKRAATKRIFSRKISQTQTTRQDRQLTNFEMRPKTFRQLTTLRHRSLPVVGRISFIEDKYATN